ncbi:MAG: SPOR domain-containing protein [Proteobacteria bacterium]|nr:SPOR domain-containing protein [Pseudomonadota bacterium]
MQQSTKQRIVGTVVLLALALIFLPIIFDGQGSYQTPIASRIPEPPEIPVLAEPIPTRPVIIADSLEEAEAEVEAAQQAEPEQPASNDAVAEADAPATAPVAGDTDDDDDNGVEVVTSQPAFSREVPQLGTDGLPQGWSVRLGSFSDSDNAANLLTRLQEAGYRAYTRTIPSDRGDLTGVFVGPWVDRIQVNEYQQELQAQFQLAGIVVPYEL